MVSLSSGGITRAALKVTAGTPVLDVSVAHLAGTLIQVSTPDGAPVRPVLTGSAPVVLSLAGAAAPDGHNHGGAYAVSVILCAAARWAGSP